MRSVRFAVGSLEFWDFCEYWMDGLDGGNQQDWDLEN